MHLSLRSGPVVLLLLCSVALASAAPRLAAADWPFVRGPNFNGHATAGELLDHFPPEGPPVLWTRPLGGGYSAVTAVGDQLYTQYQTLGGQYVICLDAATGNTVWEYRYDAPYDLGGLYPGPRGTPTWAKGRLFFAAPSGLVGCLDAAQGKLIWSLNLFEQFGVEPVEFGYSCSLTVVEDQVFLPVGKPNASMVALDAATGRVLWQAGNDPISHVPAMPIEVEGRKLILGYLRNTLVAFDRQQGEVVWRMRLSSGYDEHAAWPIYREPYLWISGPFQAGSELIELASDPPGYHSLWRKKILSNDVCSSVLVGDHLYGFDLRDVQTKLHRPSRGQFRCVEFLTGRESWANGTLARAKPEDEAQAVGHAAVIYADGKLILFNDTGELILARANPNRYEELGRARVLGGEICWTAPTLHRDCVVVRNHSRIACLVLSKSGRTALAPTAAQLTVADIPQTTYRDWSAWILAVEPEYAMDLPTSEQIWRWYVATLGGYLVCALLAGLGIALWGRQSRAALAGASAGLGMSARVYRRAHGGLAFTYGVCGTTLLSGYLQEFILTWPLALFVALQAILSQVKPRRASGGAVRGWLELLAFILFCWGYFWLCGRLSLAFEWVFLGGFAAAVPGCLLATWHARGTRWPKLVETLWLLAAYSAYFGASILILRWKYA